jgi:hypothetical protein
MAGLQAYLLICQQLLADVTCTVLTAIVKLQGMFRGDSRMQLAGIQSSHF